MILILMPCSTARDMSVVYRNTKEPAFYYSFYQTIKSSKMQEIMSPKPVYDLLLEQAPQGCAQGPSDRTAALQTEFIPS